MDHISFSNKTNITNEDTSLSESHKKACHEEVNYNRIDIKTTENKINYYNNTKENKKINEFQHLVINVTPISNLKECAKYDDAINALSEVAITLYNKTKVCYSDIVTIITDKNNQKSEYKKWADLALEDQIDLLNEGARGEDKNEVKILKEENDKLSKNSSQNEQKSNILDLKLKIRSLVTFNYDSLDNNALLEIYDHGYDHAMRAYSLIKPVAYMYKKYFKIFENLSEKDIFLAQICALFHDTGRQAEGIDIFDSLSANYAEQALISLRKKVPTLLDEEDIKIVIDSIKNKDKDPTDETKSLTAVLLHEVDCLEYARLGYFKKEYLDIYNMKDKFLFQMIDDTKKQSADDSLNKIIAIRKNLNSKANSKIKDTSEIVKAYDEYMKENENKDFSI